ncbi:hypothetical protein SK128_014510 [Halocaridina rubra]|uniref:Uncharacterized protein n=1 Tax=Halocaridina rubra TaxID=373956 RepID=A0AAN8X0I8_HALRR
MGGGVTYPELRVYYLWYHLLFQVLILITYYGCVLTDARRLAQLVCTSREVLIAILVSAAILQICIILVAIMCVFARLRKRNEGDTQSSNLTLTRGVLSPYPTVSEDSATTLKTLRTSLRD